ncbi:hypothetical protein DWB77_05179 [Streptomyces hundungensis]|uniref:Uncharacterized protein n=1 Tax=Streptomyces hundungensis TaxID=1077946 RepID=A0A387HQJ9_9ACTN|nr:hypothetical protein [Streptomyces hundungensis]AYG82987.1 hypothetical protein DWB77_05179 [Streptomyces hundungensis]
MRIDRLAARELGEFWSLREDVTVLFGQSTVLRTPWGELRLERPGALLREALHRMQLGPVSLANVVPGFPGYDVPEDEWNDASRELLGALAPLQHLIVRHIAIGASPVLSVVPLSPRATFRPPPIAPGGEFRVPEDVVLRRAGGDPVLAHEGCAHRIELHGPDAPRLLVHLQEGTGDFRSPLDVPLPQAVVRAARAYAVAAGMLCTADLKGAARL